MDNNRDTTSDFLDMASAHAGLDWHEFVETDPRYFRPAEVDFLLGNASHARERLGWEPKVRFDELVRMMVEHDLELARQERTLAHAGHKLLVRGVAHG
ncbi:MAG: GDP-mannose 4,6-dehydratase [Bryobacteraceae bacterium]